MRLFTSAHVCQLVDRRCLYRLANKRFDKWAVCRHLRMYVVHKHSCEQAPTNAGRKDPLQSDGDCLPAQLLLRYLQQQLGGVHVSGRHLWLLHSPCPHMHDRVWEVVALAALTALLKARKHMWALHCARRTHPQGQSPLRQVTLHEAWSPRPDRLPLQQQRDPFLSMRPAATAARRAVLDFYNAIQDFVCQGIVPTQWRTNDSSARLGPRHPVLTVMTQHVHHPNTGCDTVRHVLVNTCMPPMHS